MFKPLIVTSVLLMSSTLLASSTDRATTQLNYDVEKAAREYRIEVYRLFRTDRDEYDRRQAVGQKSVEAWKTGGRRPGEARELIQWFAEATSAVGTEDRPIPSVPQFVLSPRRANQQSSPDWADPSGPSWPIQQPAGIPHARQPATAEIERFAGDELSISNGPEDSSSSSVVRGLGRALWRTVGAGASPSRGPDLLQPLPAQDAVSSSAPTQEPQIDLDDLKARVDGYKPSLSSVNAILAGDDPISTDQLALLVGEIEGLVERYNTLLPYLSLPTLTDEDRAYIGQLASPADALGQLQKRVEQVRTELTGDAQPTDDSTTGDELDQLNRIGERLEKLSVDSAS